jgi:methyl-accepting chemotaxis protein
LATGNTASDVWINRQRQEQVFVSIAPVRGDQGAILGAVVVGVPLNDERMRRTGELTSGSALLFGVVRDGAVELVARGAPSSASDALAEIAGPKFAAAAVSATRARNVVTGEFRGGEWIFAVCPLDGFSSTQLLLVSAMPTSLVPSIAGLLAPLFGAIALGIVLVIVAGWLLGNYFTQPLSELEDGLLAVINGNQTLRFDIEHAEFGGLAFRINSLLNALMGVPEGDTADEQGGAGTSNAQGYGDPAGGDET